MRALFEAMREACRSNIEVLDLVATVFEIQYRKTATTNPVRLVFCHRGLAQGKDKSGRCLMSVSVRVVAVDE